MVHRYSPLVTDRLKTPKNRPNDAFFGRFSIVVNTRRYYAQPLVPLERLHFKYLLLFPPSFTPLNRFLFLQGTKGYSSGLCGLNMRWGDHGVRGLRGRKARSVPYTPRVSITPHASGISVGFHPVIRDNIKGTSYVFL